LEPRPTGGGSIRGKWVCRVGEEWRKGLERVLGTARKSLGKMSGKKKKVGKKKVITAKTRPTM